MSPALLQQFLHRHIPATAALQLSVAQTQPTVTILAPHAPNRNHKNTVFGGSIALAATACGWAFVHLLCPEAEGNIVIQTGSTDYLKPAKEDLRAETVLPDEEALAHFHHMLAERGKGKITLTVNVYSGNTLAAVFQGKYVAFTAV